MWEWRSLSHDGTMEELHLDARAHKGAASLAEPESIQTLKEDTLEGPRSALSPAAAAAAAPPAASAAPPALASAPAPVGVSSPDGDATPSLVTTTDGGIGGGHQSKSISGGWEK